LAGIEEIAFQKDLAVGDRDDVRRDVSGDVSCLGFDDRQRRQRAAAPCVAQFGRALKQPGVKIKNIAWEGLTARRPA
jgi:hypothetical protein